MYMYIFNDMFYHNLKKIFLTYSKKKKKKKKIPDKISVNFSFYRKFFNFLDFLGHIKHLTSLKDAEKNTAKS